MKDGGPTQLGTGGMSLRDWFAGMAMQGLYAGYSGVRSRGTPDVAWPDVAREAYAIADAMLAERDKPAD